MTNQLLKKASLLALSLSFAVPSMATVKIIEKKKSEKTTKAKKSIWQKWALQTLAKCATETTTNLLDRLSKEKQWGCKKSWNELNLLSGETKDGFYNGSINFRVLDMGKAVADLGSEELLSYLEDTGTIAENKKGNAKVEFYKKVGEELLPVIASHIFNQGKDLNEEEKAKPFYKRIPSTYLFGKILVATLSGKLLTEAKKTFFKKGKTRKILDKLVLIDALERIAPIFDAKKIFAGEPGKGIKIGKFIGKETGKMIGNVLFMSAEGSNNWFNPKEKNKKHREIFTKTMLGLAVSPFFDPEISRLVKMLGDKPSVK
ncbi:hypothetical protein KAU11_02810 [Candidatus Babeliales bacterium]|nr:hypothetical protein [Candidatus Babeliales bacterium]